jgi:hypothetical protein
MTRDFKWMKSGIGFKDGRTINDHEIIKQGMTW